MTQSNYLLDNVSYPAGRIKINEMHQAAQQKNSGSTAPAVTFPHQYWLDTGNSLLKQRDAANSAWIEIARVSASSYVPIADFNAVPLEDSTGKCPPTQWIRQFPIDAQMCFGSWVQGFTTNDTWLTINTTRVGDAAQNFSENTAVIEADPVIARFTLKKAGKYRFYGLVTGQSDQDPEFRHYHRTRLLLDIAGTPVGLGPQSKQYFPSAFKVAVGSHNHDIKLIKTSDTPTTIDLQWRFSLNTSGTRTATIEAATFGCECLRVDEATTAEENFFPTASND